MNLTPPGSPITRTPTYRRYSDGKTYTVWKEANGKIRRRRCSHRNTIDKPNSSRTPGFVNNIDRRRKSGTVNDLRR
ncbi:MAG: hypothetical protein KAS32_06190 [Candidatus Peribacteraceae bacterium]|nr:hypothetical protein [Candidatus Peribacteraceae bacterium]